jgi:myosin-5
VQEEYTEEGIEWSYVEFQDNQQCLDLMEKGACIISILNEECMINGTDIGFVEKTHTVFRRHKHFMIDKTNNGVFGIRHYAAKVCVCIRIIYIFVIFCYLLPVLCA